MAAARLRSDFWVAAHLRRCAGEGVDAVLLRRGAAEAGAIFVAVDRLDGTVDLYGPAPPSPTSEEGGERLFELLLAGVSAGEAEARMAREVRFDPDLWRIAIDDRDGRSLLPLRPGGDEPR